MRKTVVALMLILPLLFVFAVFSSGQVAGLGVSIAVNGVEILNAPDGDVLAIDIADPQEDFVIDALVTPENASDKSVVYRVEAVEGAPLADVSVDEHGRVTAKSAGSARVVVATKDGGYTDSFVVLASSSKPYDFELSLTAVGDDVQLLTSSSDGLYASVAAGAYAYGTDAVPAGFAEAQVQVTSGFAVVQAGTLTFPFSGRTTLDFCVQDGAFGAISHSVTVDVSVPETVSGIVVNGSANASLAVESGSSDISFFVQAKSEIELKSEYISSKTITQIDGAGEHCYRVDAILAPDRPDNIEIQVCGADGSATVAIANADFAFSVSSTLPVQGADAVILTGGEVTFFAVPSVLADDVEYVWTIEDATSDDISIETHGDSCTIGASSAASFKLVVRPTRGGYPLDVYPIEIQISAIDELTSVQIADRTDLGLARELVIAGSAYRDGKTVSNTFTFDLRAFFGARPIADCVDDLEFSVSDPAIAELVTDGNSVSLRPVENGEVTVTAAWKGNGAFGRNVASSITLKVAADAVSCTTSAQVFDAADKGLAIVLDADIMLGEEFGGNVSAMRARLGSMRSTYNAEFYSNTGRESEAVINYVLEFKNDLYGNGHTLNAELFTTAADGTGMPLLFKGPLDFVSLGDSASVAGQDNSAFLIRTDGVEISNVTLLGCSDAAIEEDGQTKLEKLNNVGTVLEVNADCALRSCRIRNGRTVVRVYGGNTSGNDYMRDALDGAPISDSDRAIVTIEKCLISQGREFLIKLGSDRALAADLYANAEPDLVDASGDPYAPRTDGLWQDDYFYSRYVMTDLTVEDCVLERSGLFSIGVESNFAGPVLARNAAESGVDFDGWAGTGGTSFASVLRLKGDVRLYDWKSLDLIDSSTLIDSQIDRFSLDLGAMLRFAAAFAPDKYGDIIAASDNGDVVHGGIALYGGGKNYAQVVLSDLDPDLADFNVYQVNISILKESDDPVLLDQGDFLPLAAGTQDFRFFMYPNDSPNSFAQQTADAANGAKYDALYG